MTLSKFLPPVRIIENEEVKVKRKNIEVCVKMNREVYVGVWEKKFEGRRRVLREFFRVYFKNHRAFLQILRL